MKYTPVPNDKYTDEMAKRDRRVIEKTLRAVNKMGKLNHKKMLKEIDELVNNDFCFDMDCKQGLPDQRPFTQSEAKKMARIIGEVYRVAHCIHCEACQGRYKLNKSL